MGNFVLIVKFNSLLYFKPVSLFPTFKPSRRVSCALLPWSEGAVKKVIYAPEILLACIQLATTTDTGGDDFIATGDGDKVGASLWFSTKFLNPAFYPHYRVRISMAPLFVQMEEKVSPYAMLSHHCFVLNPQDSVR